VFFVELARRFQMFALKNRLSGLLKSAGPAFRPMK
jgi:hypothetical protein